MAKRKKKPSDFDLLNADQGTLGHWIDVQSSWVRSIMYDGGTLYVRFRDGAMVGYDGVGLLVYLAFLRAPSKGRFVWDHLYHLPYVQYGK